MHSKTRFYRVPQGLTINDPGGVLLPRKWPFMVLLEQVLTAQEYAYCDEKAPLTEEGGGRFILVYLSI
jgi:hypothetical protein